MKEDFLHYIWKYKKFDFTNLQTTTGQKVTILKSGEFTKQAGPDFFNAQIEIESQKWAGNIEVHVNASDWYLHNHQNDTAYHSVILHVVWQNDSEIFSANNEPLPVLELKNYVNQSQIENYNNLKQEKSWIYCENQIKSIPQFVYKNWQEKLFFNRLEQKSKPVFELLQHNQNNWEETFYILLAKNFGLNTNGELFYKMAQNIPFDIIRKENNEPENLEALFFGNCNLLNNSLEDNYYQNLQKTWNYLQVKYKLEQNNFEKPQFFKLRPDNFPTIRLSQLAVLLNKNQNLFSKIIQANSIFEIETVLKGSTTNYWETHFTFDKISAKKIKSISKSFIHLLVINTIIPIKFAYSNFLGKDNSEDLMLLLESLPSEKNTVIDKFQQFGIASKNAFDSQTLLHLKKNYCTNSMCLQCGIGLELLKK